MLQNFHIYRFLHRCYRTFIYTDFSIDVTELSYIQISPLCFPLHIINILLWTVEGFRLNYAYCYFKETLSVISSMTLRPPCKDDSARLTRVPLKALSGQVRIWKLVIFNCGFSSVFSILYCSCKKDRKESVLNTFKPILP